ncbi:histone-lysine N-methyltransferase Set2 [Euwallacea fornicatus]|uniref:histone-lysine N-methyltransferase Set2 n=1 Tax=Euwallacea fornicatus TaxID=995702 RepID=UPI00338D4D11
MPPKKKKTLPVVVGTVSTRSTRRESIVNVEIIPRASKKSLIKKTTQAIASTVKSNHETDHKIAETDPEIVQILKDWSDDDSSKNEALTTDKIRPTSPMQVAADEQSLIDILEGKQSDDLSMKIEGDQNATVTVLNRSAIKKDILTENPIVNIDSPKVDESDIIEECVVEDNSFIIESPEVQSSNAESNLIDDKSFETSNIASESTQSIEKDSEAVKFENASEGIEMKLETNYPSDMMEKETTISKIEPTETTIICDENDSDFEMKLSGGTDGEQTVMEDVIESSCVRAEDDLSQIKNVYPIDHSVEDNLCEKISESMHISAQEQSQDFAQESDGKNMQEKSVDASYTTGSLLNDEMSKMSLKNVEQDSMQNQESSPIRLKDNLQDLSLENEVKDIETVSSEKHIVLVSSDILLGKTKCTNVSPIPFKESVISTSGCPETIQNPILYQDEMKTSFSTSSENIVEFKLAPMKLSDIKVKLEALCETTEQMDIESESSRKPETNTTEVKEEESISETPRPNDDDENVIIWRIPQDSPKRETKIADCWFVKPPKHFRRGPSSMNLQLIDETIDEVLQKYACDDQQETNTSSPLISSISVDPISSVYHNQQDEILSQPSTSNQKNTFSQYTSFPNTSSSPKSTLNEQTLSQEGVGATQKNAGSKGKLGKESKIKKNSDSKKKNKPKKEGKGKKDEASEEVRRSDRIKTIPQIKKKSYGLVKSKSELSLDAENSDSNSIHDKSSPTTFPPLAKPDKSKLKSKSSDNLEIESLLTSTDPKVIALRKEQSAKAEIDARLKTFVHLKENVFKTDRQTCKEAKEMVCDCYLAEEDIQNNEFGCGDDCLNRLLMIECGDLCQVRNRCTNKRFQKSLFAPVEVFKTEKKGLGLRAAANIAYGEFIIEYVGEVVNPEEFDKRAEVYSKDKNIHFYFMSLRADAIIDATTKGNISRFINHSCDPNAETEKWTVNGELRIGFFSTRTILAGEEITFDYRFQRYGKEAQRCYCEAATCRGWLGDGPSESEDEEDEEEDEASKISSELANAETELSSDIPKPPAEIQTEPESMEVEATPQLHPTEVTAVEMPQTMEPLKKSSKKKSRKEVLYEEIDQLNEDIEMLLTTGLKNQTHTLKLSRLMVRAKDLEQRKKLLRTLRRGELACRRLFLDYHGLRLMHGYMIDAQQLKNNAKASLEVMQTKLEVLQTLAVLPIQNKTMLIESKVLPAVTKWSTNEDIEEDGEPKHEGGSRIDGDGEPQVKEIIDEIKFLASKLLEEWMNLKEIFRIPKRQRIEQMKEHEKEANKKYMEGKEAYSQEKESSRKNDHQRYRSWSRYKSERETSKRGSRMEERDRPSAEFLKISKHERRKLFALQMELREEERRMKQRELWRQHEINCMLIGADPRFTAPFDPSKGFQYIWNPSLGQWQALPSSQSQRAFGSPATNSQGTPTKQHVLNSFASPMMSVPGSIPGTPQYPGLQPNLPAMVPGIASSLPNPVPGVAASLPVISTTLPNPMTVLPGMNHAGLPPYQESKEDSTQVKFAGPIPPPAKLPPKWKCAKDKYGRPYYYHVKIRKSQWEPPLFPEPVEPLEEYSTSSDTTSSSTSESSSESYSDDDLDDSRLLQEVRKQMKGAPSKAPIKSTIPDHIKKEKSVSMAPSPEIKVQTESDDEEDLNLDVKPELDQVSSIDIRLKEQFNVDSTEVPKKKKRTGLCQEIIISPRTEADRIQSKEDLKRYKATKEKLKRQKELLQAKKKLKTSSASELFKGPKEKKVPKVTVKTKIKEMKEWNDEHAKKIKEVFRSTMAHTVVGVLNAYRKPDCLEARITNTEDFKHLARKLTHFVMLKEMKHIPTIDDLVCSDNVKAKAKEYIRKYMSKFGEVYQKRHDEPDFKD